MNQKYKGVICIILSAFCFAFMNAFVRLAGDLPSIQKSFFRNLVAFFFALIILLRSKEKITLSKESVPFLLLRSIFGTLGILCNFYAVDHLVLSDASILNKMSPFFTILFSFIFLKERLTAFQTTAVVVAFVGSLFIIKPTLSNMDLLPSVLGLLGGIAAGAAYTMVRKLGTQGVKGPFVVFFFSGFSCLVTLPFLIIGFEPMTWFQLLTLLGAGLAAAGGQFSITAAYYYAPAREISVYDYSQIIFAALLGFILFGQVPDGFSVLGYVIIIGVAIVMFWYNNKRHKENS
ncbi:MAG: DMT family transporter [Ruminococcus sp.]|nr:DMT family transporter [Ruminococcus sp.]